MQSYKPTFLNSQDGLVFYCYLTSLLFLTHRIFIKAVRNILSCFKQYKDAWISSYVYQKIPRSDFHIELHSQAHSTELCMTFLMVEQKE